MDRVIKGILIILWLSLLTFGCATTRMYEGEQLPNEQIAILKGSLQYYVYAHLQVTVRKVDGYDIRYLPGNEVEVLPGWHEIQVLVRRGLVTGDEYDYYTLSFYATPGHKYQVKSSYWKTKDALVTVLDTRSGEIVASQPRKSFQHYPNNWHWYKPDVDIEQLKQDYSECRAKGKEKSCMEERGYVWGHANP